MSIRKAERGSHAAAPSLLGDGKKSDGVNPKPSSSAARRISVFSLSGIEPREAQEPTVDGGLPILRAIGRVPPKALMIAST